MHKWWLIIAGFIVFGASLLAHLPARLFIPEHSGEFRLIGISGSVWNGEIRQILLSDMVLPIGSLHWTVSPTTLLSGTPRAHFCEQQTSTNCGNMDFNLLSREAELNALHWELPAGSIESLIPMPGVRVQGQSILDLQVLQIPPSGLFPSRSEGQLEWQNAGLLINSEPFQIGSPFMQFSNDGDAINGIVTNSQPTLPGDITFQCTAKSCQVSLSLQPTADVPQIVLNSLLLMGLQQSGDKFSGQISFPIVIMPSR